MTQYEVKQVTMDEALEIAPLMREADVAECWAAARMTPEDAIRISVENSEHAFMGYADGRPVCIFGVRRWSPLSLLGIPWLLGAEELPDHAKVFLRLNRKYVKYLQNEFLKLENYVDARNTDALKWLRWLGFTINDPVPFGPDRLPFHYFYWKKETA